MTKIKLKVGILVKVITGKYRQTIDKIKKINRKLHKVYLETVSKQKFVKNKDKDSNQKEQRNTKEVFIPIDISNVVPCEEESRDA